MEKEFVTYEQALALKELGFDEDCLRIWKKQIPFNSFDIQDFKIVGSERCILSPLKQQVFRLFREKYNYWSYVYPYIHDKTWHFHVQFYDSDMWGEVFLGNNYSNYEEAENACINKLIEIAKQQ